MKKSPGKNAHRRTAELEPFDPRKVNLAKFTADFPPGKLRALLGPLAVRFPTFLFPLETLSVTKTVGRGRTNLTFIRPTIVQADATVPFAAFNRRESPTRAPAIQMHFEPRAYGITTVGSYLMEFVIETTAPATFRVDGSPGHITNAGQVTLNGRRVVTLAFQNVPPDLQIFGFVEQTAGEGWTWFSVNARFPLPVLTTGA